MSLFVTAVLLLIPAASLEGAGKKLEVRDADTINTVLDGQVGKTVELILVSGTSLKGKIVKVTQHTVHISELTGKEFYDAVVRSSSISAAIIRVK